MSKLRALELAVQCLAGRSDFLPSGVVELATSFATFLGEETPVKPATTRTRKPADPTPVVADPEPSQPAAEAAPAAQKPATQTPAPAASAAPAAAGGVTEADIKKAVGALAQNAAAGGAPEARKILQKYGATNISTLKAEHYAKAKADIDAVLAAAEVAG